MNTRDHENIVSFRIDGTALAKLESVAKASGLSCGREARRMLLATLHDEQRAQVLEELRALRQDLKHLRADLATTLEAVLLNLAHVSPREVEQFLSETLRR